MENLPKTRILIIEDNPDDVELLMRQLKKAHLGEQVKVVSDGRLALDFLISDAEHLVAMFLDLMTSSNSPADLAECEALHVSSYVQKPVTFELFSKAVANTFHRTELSKPSASQE